VVLFCFASVLFLKICYYYLWCDLVVVVTDRFCVKTLFFRLFLSSWSSCTVESRE
jgi:hypothetical protein